MRGRRWIAVHRLLYEFLVGPIPDGAQLHHKCEVTKCVNPDHLEPVSAQEHLSRHPRPAKTHCHRGHPFDERNTRVRPNGHRTCRACERDRRRRRPAVSVAFGLAVCATLFASTWVGGFAWASDNRAGGVEPTRADLRQGVHQQRALADRYRRNRCLPARQWGTTRGKWRVQLSEQLYYAQHQKIRTLSMNWRACWAWYRSSGARCVVSREGAWGSNTGNGYFGAFQMDLSFQAAYGGNWLRRFGTADKWLPRYQINAAFRGYQARGWQPWPSTARACGLL